MYRHQPRQRGPDKTRRGHEQPRLALLLRRHLLDGLTPPEVHHRGGHHERKRERDTILCDADEGRLEFECLEDVRARLSSGSSEFCAHRARNMRRHMVQGLLPAASAGFATAVVFAAF